MTTYKQIEEYIKKYNFFDKNLIINIIIGSI